MADKATANASKTRKRNDDYEINSILVKTATGKIITLEVEGSDTIGNVKAKIEDKEHIPFNQQELVFQEMVLDDIYTLANLPLKKDSTLTLMRKLTVFISINIDNLQGKSLFSSLKVKPSYTIRDVKDKLCCSDGVLAFNGNVLDDSGTLADFHIYNGSTLTLIPKYTNSMEIFVKTLTGKTVVLSVYPTDTIAGVKSKIEQTEKIPCDEQVLIFKKMVLENSCTLSDLCIDNNSTLKLTCKSKGFMKVFIKTANGKTITLEVKRSDTIDNVKSKIQDKIHVPCDKQVLTFNGVFLDNMRTLADFHVTNGSTLTLVSRGFMKIFIDAFTGETITLEVKPSDTIDNIKIKIQYKIHVPCYEQVLTFNEVVLDDMNTLADFHITKGSRLKLMSRGFMQIFIRTLTRKTIVLDVQPTDTISYVKSKIHDKEGIHTCNQKLIFSGRQVEDSSSLAAYHISRGSTLYLLLAR